MERDATRSSAENPTDAGEGMTNSQYPTLLLLTQDSAALVAIGSAARRMGYTVSTGRSSETGVDALRRVEPQLAIVQVEHPAADSIAFNAIAQHQGTRVVLFARRTRNAAVRAAVTMTSFRSPFPVIEFDGDGDDLLAKLERTLAA